MSLIWDLKDLEVEYKPKQPDQETKLPTVGNTDCVIEDLNDFITRHNLPVVVETRNTFASLEDRFGDLIDMDRGSWIAGGSVLALIDGRYLTNRDVDFFFASRQQAKALEKAIPLRINITEMFQSGNALNLNTKYDKLQLITRDFYPSVKEMLNSFDFTVCQFATDGKKIAYTVQAYADWTNKVLRHTQTVKEPGTVNRFIKYSLHGYNFDTATYSKIFKWINENPAFFTSASGY